VKLRLLGYKSAADMIGRPVWKFVVMQETAQPAPSTRRSGRRGPETVRPYLRAPPTAAPIRLLNRGPLITDSAGAVVGICTVIGESALRAPDRKNQTRTARSRLAHAILIHDARLVGHDGRRAEPPFPAATSVERRPHRLRPAPALPAIAQAERRPLDARARSLLARGLVNHPHHHLPQGPDPQHPAVQQAPLFGWLKPTSNDLALLDAGAVGVAAARLEASCSSPGLHDEHRPSLSVPSPEQTRFIDRRHRGPPREVGIRFHPTRGSMKPWPSEGGAAPDDVVQDEAEILADSRPLIAGFLPRPRSRGH